MSQIADRLQSQKRSWAHPGSSHDRMVRLGRVALPGGILVLAAFLIASPLVTHGEMSFLVDKNKVEMAQERLWIEAAEYRGADAKGRAFRLHAGSAVQQSSAVPVVQMNDLSAEMTLPEGPAALRADRGHYDMDKQQVAVDGPLRFQTSDGYTLDTRDTTVDLKTRTMQSGGAVSGSTPMGVFSGDRLSADLEKHTVSLDGNARLRMFPRRGKRR